MFGGLFIVSIISSIVQIIKEACEQTIPAENFANTKLIKRDKLNGISDKQLWKNIENGKYVLKQTYSEPPKDEYGNVIIENNILYKEDVKKYGWYEAKMMAKRGKYNLSKEEKEREKNRVDKKYEPFYMFK